MKQQLERLANFANSGAVRVDKCHKGHPEHANNPLTMAGPEMNTHSRKGDLSTKLSTRLALVEPINDFRPKFWPEKENKSFSLD